MPIVKTPEIAKTIFSSLLWSVPTKSKEIYLTFDDGPIPEVTPWVLNELEKYNAKATFFCIGDNIQKHPIVFKSIIEKGHSIGNHTQNHFNSWVVSSKNYLENIEKCQQTIFNVIDIEPSLFRPPYGKFKPLQIQKISKKYKVVLWDVLSRDFDENTSNNDCLDNVINHAIEGSIIVFHDSLKAKEKLEFVLPKVLQHFSEKGYSFKAIN